MKKTITAMIALLLVVSLCACAQTPAAPDVTGTPEVVEPTGEPAPETPDEPDAPLIGLPNPMTEYGSLGELNELLGVKLAHPAVMGVNDESFYLINGGTQIAQYNFTLNGVDYTFRASPVYDTDISGYYIDGGTAFSGTPTDELEFAEYDGTKLARWATIDGQYVLAGENAPENFADVAAEMAKLTRPGMSDEELAAYYASLEGAYSDSTSKRAVLHVEANGSDGIIMTAHWSSSAFENTEWKMTARLDADGLLSYSDLTETHICTGPSEGEDTTELIREGGVGHFVESEGKLLWLGADDEACRDCVFERYEELYGEAQDD